MATKAIKTGMKKTTAAKKIVAKKTAGATKAKTITNLKPKKSGGTMEAKAMNAMLKGKGGY